MEDFFVNIDSKYRDITLYPSESKFKINLNRMYKNIISVKFMSIELINNVSYIDTAKNNNYITFHFPTKEQDPIGYVYTFPEGFFSTFNLLSSTINNNLFANVNSIGAFENINNERYCYIFYLQNSVSITITDSTDTYTFRLQNGWYSLYGLVLLLSNYIKTLGIINFTINAFSLQILDKRFASTIPQYNNIRIDDISQIVTFSNNLNTNLNLMKNAIYSQYITDTNNFITSITGTGILDTLVYNTYSIDATRGYILSGTLSSGSKYYINNSKSVPSSTSIQLYNLYFSQDPTSTKTILTSANGIYFLFDAVQNTWTPTTNNLVTNPSNDLPIFELNIETNSTQSQGYAYPSVGFYMGFRQTLQRSNNNVIRAEKLGNYIGDSYIFIKMNNWGHIDLFNQRLLAKILLISDMGLVQLNEFYSKEYKFKQPMNVDSLTIELVDYLGNTVDLRGLDYAFTLQLIQINNSDLKYELEYNFLDKKK
jgi:hypothetical protein